MLRTRSRKSEDVGDGGGDGEAVSGPRREDPEEDLSSDAVREIHDLLEQASLTEENVPPHRLYYMTRVIEDPGYSSVEKLETATKGEADLVASKTLGGKHAPTLDIDMPCRLVPSSTPGHFHLYIDMEMSEKHYKKLLAVLVEVGIVEEGFAQMLERKGATFVRMPGKPKLLPGETTRRNRKNDPSLRY
jgi:hypothetical protein